MTEEEIEREFLKGALSEEEATDELKKIGYTQSQADIIVKEMLNYDAESDKDRHDD